MSLMITPRDDEACIMRSWPMYRPTCDTDREFFDEEKNSKSPLRRLRLLTLWQNFCCSRLERGSFMPYTSIYRAMTIPEQSVPDLDCPPYLYLVPIHLWASDMSRSIWPLSWVSVAVGCCGRNTISWVYPGFLLVDFLLVEQAWSMHKAVITARYDTNLFPVMICVLNR